MGKKGQIAWNKGKKLSPDHVRHLKEAHMGQVAWNVGLKGAQKRTEKSKKEFSLYAKKHGFGKWLKGKTPWNKGKKGLQNWKNGQREKWFKWANSEKAQTNFRSHGVKTMKEMIKKDTRIEILLGNMLDELKLKSEKNFNLLGITLTDRFIPKYNIAIFTDGCYWHSCQIHRKVRNDNVIKKDKRITKSLKDNGYIVLRFWEHEFNNLEAIKQKIKDTVETTRDGQK